MFSMTSSEFSEWLKENLSIEQMCAIITYVTYKRNPDGYCDSIDSFFDKLRLRPKSTTMDISLFTPYMHGIPDTDKIREECSLSDYELETTGAFSENKLYRLHASKYDDEVVDLFWVSNEEINRTLLNRVWASVSRARSYEDPIEIIEKFIENPR